MINNFSKEKQDFLNKKDKSTKGSWDEEILELLDFINSLDDYYTTSSCAGRIVLISGHDKKQSEWLFVSHSLVDVSDIKIKKECWFLQESPIVHIRCRNLEATGEIIKIAHNVGLKRAGIISLENFTVEIRGNERMECPVSTDLDGRYIEKLVSEANKKLLKSREVFARFLEEMKKRFI